MNPKQLRDLSDHLHEKKAPLNSLHQEISDAFYPERAIFTLKRSLGMDFASNLMTSYPVLCRRDLGNQFGTMLRPTAKSWFHVKRRDIPVEREDLETKGFLQSFEQAQRSAMYDRRAHLTRAAKEGDHDFAAFGQCAISTELKRDMSGLQYRCWHLKDMAWQEDEDGEIGVRSRKWKAHGRDLVRLFGDKIHDEITRKTVKHPFQEWNIVHIVVPGDLYDKKGRFPWWGLWYDIDHDQLIADSGMWTGYYRIPRWQTVSGSQYSYSPAAVAALPDARMLQAMTFTLLEAGEKAAAPPMVATIEAVRSEVALHANGVTWVSDEYDERLGDALRPLTQDFRGFQYGLKLNEDARAMINRAFFLDKLNMPERNPEMTAYEVGQRIQQYIRDALPIFEPMEQEYNAGLCDDTFELLWRTGAFGSPTDWPRQLQGAEIDFTFESPLHDAIEEAKGQLLLQGEGLQASAMKVDPSVASLVDGREALRDALLGIGWPTSWLRSDEELQQIDAEHAQEQSMQQILAGAGQGAKAASDLGTAAKSFAQAQGG